MTWEAELVARVVAGDPGAAEEFVEQYHRFVYSVLNRRLNFDQDAVEEVFQETWFRLWEDRFRRLRQWRGRGSLLSWLGTLVGNLAKDYLRSRRRRARNPDIEIEDEPAAEEPDGRDLALARELRAATADSLELLRPRDRRIIELRHFEEMSYREIAAAMDMTVTNVGVALGRAEGRLRALVLERYPDLAGQGREEEGRGV